MKCNVYSIRDVHTGFLNPTFEVSDAVAKRNFAHAVLAVPDSLFTSHPDDYSLYRIGEFDTDSGSIVGFAPPALVVDARSILNMRGDRDGH